MNMKRLINFYEDNDVTEKVPIKCQIFKKFESFSFF